MGKDSGRVPSATAKPDGIFLFELTTSGIWTSAEGTVGPAHEVRINKRVKSRGRRSIENALYVSSGSLRRAKRTVQDYTRSAALTRVLRKGRRLKHQM